MACGCCGQAGVNKATCGKGTHQCKKEKCGVAQSGVAQSGVARVDDVSIDPSVKKVKKRGHVTCQCCGLARRNVSTCGKGDHVCTNENLICLREKKIAAKLRQMAELECEKVTRGFLTALPFRGSGEDAGKDEADDGDGTGGPFEVVDLQRTVGGLRIVADECLDIPEPIAEHVPCAVYAPSVNGYPVHGHPVNGHPAYEYAVIHDHVKAVMAGNNVNGDFYVGVTDSPVRRSKQHTLQGKSFTRMLVVARVAHPLTAKYLERYLIAVLKPALNRSTGGEGVSPLAPYNYVYIGYGQTVYNLRP